jgi:antitoxin MazE
MGAKAQQSLDCVEGYVMDIPTVRGNDPMTHAILGRWGKNLALRLPHEVASELRLREGERVEVVTGPGEIVIRRAKPRFTPDELFAGKSPSEWRSIYANAHEWGADLGQENVEE